MRKEARKLSDPELSIQVPHLLDLVLASNVPSTTSKYSCGWARWRRWTQSRQGVSFMPAHPLCIALYLLQLTEQEQVKRLFSQTWNTLKSMGLLRRFRGIRKPQNTSHIFPIQSMIATNFEFEYSETRTTHPRRANFNNLISIQLDTSKQTRDA